MAQARVALALCALLLLHGVAWEARAASYTVGNSAGWDISADLQSWAAAKIFNVGDVLVFTYSKTHTLDEVDAAGFKSCSAANALLSSSDGNTTVPLTAGGDRYFICGHQMHCLGGMKLHVHVTSPAGSTTPGAPAGAPRASPGAARGPAGGTDDDAGIPRLDLGGSHRLGVVWPALATLWLCLAAALFA
ncbi:stellacyanin [Aegilops tauschii subsp. strangulata]|uniref:Phytocyanin domain-containing protein n=1 Tax=Aegilops tauschii subsp. strangulata TaxID=200361 RepID=A0A453CKF7_AEGTS|nr:stellacyanin [Aegilops tauschii subsp. strangulata]